MSKLLSRGPGLVKLIIAFGILLLLISTFSWARYVYSSPTRVFDRMLASSLATNSVSKSVTQFDDTQKVDQITTLMTKPEQQVHATSVLSQAGDAQTTITTESIATPKVEFVRYTDIKTSEKNAEGKAFNFSSVIGTWGRSSGGNTQLFSQTLLGAIPVANMPQPQRQALIKQIKATGVYKIEQGSVKRHSVNGRPVYTYSVTVQPVPYVTMLKSLAAGLGLKQLEEVDPNEYANSTPLKFTIDVDVWSGQLTKLAYADSQRTELLSGHGIRVPADLPESFIPVNELQSRLQQIR